MPIPGGGRGRPAVPPHGGGMWHLQEGEQHSTLRLGVASLSENPTWRSGAALLGPGVLVCGSSYSAPWRSALRTRAAEASARFLVRRYQQTRLMRPGMPLSSALGR